MTRFWLVPMVLQTVHCDTRSASLGFLPPEESRLPVLLLVVGGVLRIDGGSTAAAAGARCGVGGGGGRGCSFGCCTDTGGGRGGGGGGGGVISVLVDEATKSWGFDLEATSPSGIGIGLIYVQEEKQTSAPSIFSFLVYFYNKMITVRNYIKKIEIIIHKNLLITDCRVKHILLLIISHFNCNSAMNLRRTMILGIFHVHTLSFVLSFPLFYTSYRIWCISFVLLSATAINKTYSCIQYLRKSCTRRSSCTWSNNTKHSTFFVSFRFDLSARQCRRGEPFGTRAYLPSPPTWSSCWPRGGCNWPPLSP